MEALSLMIDKATEGGYISGYKFKGRNGTVSQITHLLFADDTLVFCKDSEDQMTFLSWILAWFCRNNQERIGGKNSLYFFSFN